MLFFSFSCLYCLLLYMGFILLKNDFFGFNRLMQFVINTISPTLYRFLYFLRLLSGYCSSFFYPLMRFNPDNLIIITGLGIKHPFPHLMLWYTIIAIFPFLTFCWFCLSFFPPHRYPFAIFYFYQKDSWRFLYELWIESSSQKN